MYCKKCGLPTVNGERRCRECGAEIDGRGPAVMIAQRAPVLARRPRPLLAAWFLGLNAAGLACMVGSAISILVLRRAGAQVNVLTSGVALAGLCLLGVGFVLLCSSLIFGVLGALRLYQNPHLRGRGLMIAGAAMWLGGAAIFFLLRQDPHFRAPAPPLSTSTRTAR